MQTRTINFDTFIHRQTINPVQGDTFCSAWGYFLCGKHAVYLQNLILKKISIELFEPFDPFELVEPIHLFAGKVSPTSNSMMSDRWNVQVKNAIWYIYIYIVASLYLYRWYLYIYIHFGFYWISYHIILYHITLYYIIIT